MPTVLIPLAQGCEELEAVTLIDLLRRAGVEVVTAGLDDQPVIGARRTCLLPDTTLALALQRDYDMVALPGGQLGADNLAKDARIRTLLQRMTQENKYTAAICAAPEVLASAGLLAGKRVTAFPGVLEKLNLSDVQLSEQAVEIDGKLITSRGPGTAMDFALELAELLVGPEKRAQVEAALQRPKR